MTNVKIEGNILGAQRIFQQLNKYFQANLTRKSKFVIFQNIYICFQTQTFFP